jgi:hypothetical protein
MYTFVIHNGLHIAIHQYLDVVDRLQLCILIINWFVLVLLYFYILRNSFRRVRMLCCIYYC